MDFFLYTIPLGSLWRWGSPKKQTLNFEPWLDIIWGSSCQVSILLTMTFGTVWGCTHILRLLCSIRVMDHVLEKRASSLAASRVYQLIHYCDLQCRSVRYCSFLSMLCSSKIKHRSLMVSLKLIAQVIYVFLWLNLSVMVLTIPAALCSVYILFSPWGYRARN